MLIILDFSPNVKISKYLVENINTTTSPYWFGPVLSYCLFGFPPLSCFASIVYFLKQCLPLCCRPAKKKDKLKKGTYNI